MKMSGKKIISLLIGAVFLGVSLTTVVGADELSGSIEAQIIESIGLVKPVIKLDVNQTGLTLSKQIDENTNYTMVNDTIRINIDKVDNSGRDSFIIPRYVFTSVLITRDPKSMPLLPLTRLNLFKKGMPPFLTRLIVAFSPLKKVDITTDNSTTEYYFNVSMHYWIGNKTSYMLKENLTMHIFTMGFFPGDVNGIISGIKWIDHRVINLREVEYI